MSSGGETSRLHLRDCVYRQGRADLAKSDAASSRRPHAWVQRAVFPKGRRCCECGTSNITVHVLQGSKVASDDSRGRASEGYAGVAGRTARCMSHDQDDPRRFIHGAGSRRSILAEEVRSHLMLHGYNDFLNRSARGEIGRTRATGRGVT